MTSHVDMLHHWHKALDEGQSVRILFVDYAKAFDHVDHCVVIQKLKTYGVPHFITRWATSFLAERQQREKISDVFSQWTTLRGGMPQAHGSGRSSSPYSSTTSDQDFLHTNMSMTLQWLRQLRKAPFPKCNMQWTHCLSGQNWTT